MRNRTAHPSQAVFMLIGKTSALTMNIAGVIKDWMLIFFSFYLFHAPVTTLNLAGYLFCCSGVSGSWKWPWEGWPGPARFMQPHRDN